MKYILFLGVLFLTSSSANPPPKAPLKKNEIYVCVGWVGSADPSQNKPSVCVWWEKREVPVSR